jgi:hypothetical protein
MSGLKGSQEGGIFSRSGGYDMRGIREVSCLIRSFEMEIWDLRDSI